MPYADVRLDGADEARGPVRSDADRAPIPAPPPRDRPAGRPAAGVRPGFGHRHGWSVPAGTTAGAGPPLRRRRTAADDPRRDRGAGRGAAQSDLFARRPDRGGRGDIGTQLGPLQSEADHSGRGDRGPARGRAPGRRLRAARRGRDRTARRLWRHRDRRSGRRGEAAAPPGGG